MFIDYCRGGVKYAELSPGQARDFNRNILKTILQLETTFFEMAVEDKRDVIIVCDRGTFDPSACECMNVAKFKGMTLL